MVRLVLVVVMEEAKVDEAVAQESLMLVSLLASEVLELVVPALEVLVEVFVDADGGLVVVHRAQQQEQTMVAERLQQEQHRSSQNLANLVVDQQIANLEAEDLNWDLSGEEVVARNLDLGSHGLETLLDLEQRSCYCSCRIRHVLDRNHHALGGRNHHVLLQTRLARLDRNHDPLAS
jgi:hypothetical protein